MQEQSLLYVRLHVLKNEYIRMNLWGWNSLESPSFSGPITLKSHSLLMADISNVVVARDDSHRIMLRVFAKPSVHIPEQLRTLGDPRKSCDRILFSSPLGAGELGGVLMGDSKTSWGYEENHSIVEYEIAEVKFQASNEYQPAYIVEYLDNLPTEFEWPTGFDDNITTRGMRTFDGDELYQFPIKSLRERALCSSLKLDVGEYTCILTAIEDEGDEGNKERRGYLVYTGLPDASTREKIRHSLSYAIGLPLIYCGHTNYSAAGELCEFVAVTPEMINGRAWNITKMPPAPLTITRHEDDKYIDPDKVSRVASGIYKNMGNYGLDSLPWRLWYADTAPYFMRPAYYGAMIEGLQKSYLKNNSKKIDGLIISKLEFKRHRETLQKYIKKQGFEHSVEEIYLKVLNNCNSASQAVKAKRFYEGLGLKLGGLEVSAWQRRNDAAHGNEIPASEIDNFIRVTCILRTMLNRIVLSLTGGSERYVDYYSYTHPDRALTDPII